jgi:hypothetical protein
MSEREPENKSTFTDYIVSVLIGLVVGIFVVWLLD